MSTYAITGTSRGIGFAFLKQLSSDPANTVIGIVRNVKDTQTKVAAEIDKSNIHIIEGDLDSYESLKKSSEAIAKITGGSLDYLIHNAARLPEASAYISFAQQGANPMSLEEEILAVTKSNVVGTVHLFSLFVPLLLKGNHKKVVHISSGMADLDLVRQLHIKVSGPYSVGKAATNLVVAKFSAEYTKEGLLFMGISPGVVDTGHFDPSKMTPEQLQSIGAFNAQLQKYAPDFKGPITPEESVKHIVSVWEKASLENGDGGSFVSHHGNQQWL